MGYLFKLLVEWSPRRTNWASSVHKNAYDTISKVLGSNPCPENFVLRLFLWGCATQVSFLCPNIAWSHCDVLLYWAHYVERHTVTNALQRYSCWHCVMRQASRTPHPQVLRDQVRIPNS